MNAINKQQKYSLSLYFFCLALIFIYLNFLRATFDEKGEDFGPLIRIMSVSAGPTFLLLSTISALIEGQLRRIDKIYQLWIVCLIFIFLGLIFNGILINRNSPRLIILDTIHYLFFLPGILIGAKKDNWPIVEKFIRLFFLINILNLIPYTFAYGDLIQGMRRNVVLGFNQIPYFFWGELGVWSYLWLSMKERSKFDKFVTILGTLLFFYFSIIFLKRAPFVNLTVFFILLVIAYRSTANIKINFKTISAFLLFISLSSTLFFYSSTISNIEKLGDRFTERGGTVISTLANSNRIAYDANLVKNQMNGVELLVGRGIGGTAKDLGNNYPEFNTSYLHNSSAQHVLKGGFFLLTVWWLGFLMILVNFFFNKDKEYIKFYVPLLVPFIFSWVFGFLSTTISFLLIMLCAGRVISKEHLQKK